VKRAGVERTMSGYYASVIDRDPRIQSGAYITDGVDLYEVTGVQRGPGVMGISTVRIMVENCRNLRCLEFLPDKIRSSFELVKAAPECNCPDAVEDIAWDADLAA
jgi:hypothetical protein